MHLNILLLATCQALMLSATSLTMASSALVGARLAPQANLATLPLGLTYFAVMLSLLPAALLMQRFGRRCGFSLGAGCGIVAGVLAGYGIYAGSFWLFCIGSTGLGVAMAFAQFYRFAAAEVATPQYKSRAISWVLAGGIVAAFAGPGIARYTQNMWPGAEFAVAFSSIVLLCGGVLLIQVFLRIPPPAAAEVGGAVRPLRVILVQPIFLVAMLCALIAYGSMNLLMVATPLAMQAHGMQFGHTAQVIQWHIVGMFAPSFFTGHLLQRYGILTVMLGGAVALLLCTLVSLHGVSFVHFLSGLVLLGVGWNFLFVGGTTLLTEAYRPSEKGLVQGLNDFLVFTAVALTALSSGYLHHTIGWAAVNQATIPVILFAAVLIVWLAARGGK